jgi:hypothetical protein
MNQVSFIFLTQKMPQIKAAAKEAGLASVDQNNLIVLKFFLAD